MPTEMNVLVVSTIEKEDGVGERKNDMQVFESIIEMKLKEREERRE